MEVRIAARKAWIQYADDKALRLAMDQRPRGERSFNVGDSVCYWRSKKSSGKRSRPRWYGRAVVIGESGRNRFVAHGSAVIKCAPEQVRASSMHERLGDSMDDSLRTQAERARRAAVGQRGFADITGEDRAVLESSPNLEAVRAKGYEVIYLTEAVDEFWLGNFESYNDKKLVSAAKEGLELDSEEEKEEAEKVRQEKSEDLAPLLANMRKLLEEHVAEVRLSSRLTESPACLVVAEKGMTPQMERLMKQMNQGIPQQKRIMEVNANHAISTSQKAHHQRRAYKTSCAGD